MGRPTEFDRDAVLDAAVHAFWLNGFEATSIQDLVQATGLNRGSLYNAFTDKVGLFEEAMRHYGRNAPSRALLDAVESGPPRATIEAFFDTIVKRANDAERKGCLITNTAAELCARDARLGAWVAASMKRLEDAIATLVKRGQKDGSVGSAQPARSLARFLVSGAQGMLVLSKAGYDARALRDVARTTLAILD